MRWNYPPPALFTLHDPNGQRRKNMRGILLWALGIPIPIIIILYLIGVF